MLLQEATRPISRTTSKGIDILLLTCVSCLDHHVKHWMITGKRPAEATSRISCVCSRARGFQVVSAALSRRDSRVRDRLLLRLQIDILGHQFNLVLVHHHQKIYFIGLICLVWSARLRFYVFSKIFWYRLSELLWCDLYLLASRLNKQGLFLIDTRIRLMINVFVWVFSLGPRLRGLEVIPLICHVWCVQEAWRHCLRFLNALCVAGNLHFFIKHKYLLDAIISFLACLLRLWDLLSSASRTRTFSTFLSLRVDSLRLGLWLCDHLTASLVVETVLKPVNLILQTVLWGRLIWYQESIIIIWWVSVYPIQSIRVVFIGGAGVHLDFIHTFQDRGGHLPDLDHICLLICLVSREIRKVEVAAGVPAAFTGSLDALKVRVLLKEGTADREEPTTLHKRKDWLQVTCRWTCLDPSAGIFFEKMKFWSAEGVIVNLLKPLGVLIYHWTNMHGKVSSRLDPIRLQKMA